VTSSNPGPNDARDWLRQNGLLLALVIAVVFFVVPRVSPFETLNDWLRFGPRLSEWAIRQAERLFVNYGYYVVFFGVLLENSMFLGLLVPGAVILILAGLAAENGEINIMWVFALAIVATMIGDTLSYLIGRLGWLRAVERTGLAEAMDRVRERMEQHTAWIILSYHMAGYSRMLGPAAAGLFRLPYRKWAPLDYAGGAIWVTVFTLRSSWSIRALRGGLPRGLLARPRQSAPTRADRQLRAGTGQRAACLR
jgi:membrane protein DedA with SNARE-associated domain